MALARDGMELLLRSCYRNEVVVTPYWGRGVWWQGAAMARLTPLFLAINRVGYTCGSTVGHPGTVYGVRSKEGWAALCFVWVIGYYKLVLGVKCTTQCMVIRFQSW